MSLYFVEPSAVRCIWEKVESLLAKGMEPSEGEMSIKDLGKMLELGQASLFFKQEYNNPTPDIAMVVQIITYPNYKIAHIITIGGRGAIDSDAEWMQIKDWLRHSGAIKIQCVCKPSRVRLWRKLGFKSVYETLRLDL